MTLFCFLSYLQCVHNWSHLNEVVYRILFFWTQSLNCLIYYLLFFSSCPVCQELKTTECLWSLVTRTRVFVRSHLRLASLWSVLKFFSQECCSKSLTLRSILYFILVTNKCSKECFFFFFSGSLYCVGCIQCICRGSILPLVQLGIFSCSCVVISLLL